LGFLSDYQNNQYPEYHMAMGIIPFFKTNAFYTFKSIAVVFGILAGPFSGYLSGQTLLAEPIREINGPVSRDTDATLPAREEGVSYLSLHNALAEALENNDRLKASRMMIDAALFGVDERQAYYKPSVDANFQYAYIDIVPGFKRDRLGNIEHTLFPFVSASQVVYSGGRLNARMEAAELGLEQEELGLMKKAMDIKLAISLNYLQLVSAMNQKHIVLENLKHLDDQEQYARLMIQAGRMSELEVYRISVERNALLGLLMKHENDQAAISGQLCALMGRDDIQVFVPADTLQLHEIAHDPDHLLEVALGNNPVWKQYELELMQQQVEIRIRESEKMPMVSAHIWAGYEFGLEQFSFLDNKRYFAGLTASMPIFDAGMNRARTQQSQVRYESMEWEREGFRKSLNAELDNLYRRLGEMRNQIQIQEHSVEQARQSYRLAMIEYQAGRRSNTDLLDIQQSLIRSELDLNDAMVSYNLSRVRLLYVLGTI
jgi:outer membrane protein